jgi:hypothetical protein
MTHPVSKDFSLKYLGLSLDLEIILMKSFRNLMNLTRPAAEL